MKYLKKFNISESISESIIKDILLDLEDDGFKYKISWYGDLIPGKTNISFSSYPFLKIEISRSSRYLYSDIKDSIDRLSGYLESEGYRKINSYKSNISGTTYRHKYTNGDVQDNIRMVSIEIDYKFSSLKLLKSKSKFIN
jgi:hypothetical protein